MNCDGAQALLAAYVDGELDLIHSLEVEKHLESCRECTLRAENQRALRLAIPGSPLHYQPPRALGRNIETALPTAGRAGQPVPRGRWLWLAIAAGVILAAFFVMRWTSAWRPAADNLVAQEILDSHLRSLLPGHITDVLSPDRHTLKPWFNGKVDFSPTVEDFAAQGFPLMGGRLDSVVGHTVAVLVYQRRQHWINVYIWPSPGASDESPAPAVPRQGYNLIHWTQAGMSYWLVSDLNTDELKTLATLLANVH